MEKIITKFKEYFGEINNKELIRNLFIILIVGIIIFIIADIIIQGGDENIIRTDINYQNESSSNILSDYSSILESKLEEILGQLKGVGKVQVMVTLEDTTEVIPAFNTTKNNETTNELDSQGGTREIVREDMTIQIVTDDGGAPIVLKEIKPTIRGVIVIAEGAENSVIKEMLYDAVKTVLGIPGNRVEVYSSK